MKFTYQYRTSDNVLHFGTVRAADKDAAFAALRAGGIKPSRLAEAPGFFNKLLGKGKRWIAIAALAAVATALAFALGTRPAAPGQYPGKKAPRHQIYGDPAVVDDMSADGFANVFSIAGERYLAAYAMPGTTFPDMSAVRLADPSALSACLTNAIAFSADDPREVAELKAIVNGMKDELREYLSDGEGTPGEFMRALEERQEKERLVYRRVKNELEENPDPALWEERNKSLRALGIRTIPRPRKKR